MSKIQDGSTLLSSAKPYLLRAFYAWIADNDCTPYIIVRADYPAVEVPLEHVENGRIVLNIATRAVGDLLLNNNFISFNARFTGLLKEIYVPIDAIIAIYAHENGHGMIFSEAESSQKTFPPGQQNTLGADKVISIKNGKPTLKIVK